MARTLKKLVWKPAFHAKVVERAKATQTLVVGTAARAALEDMLETDPAPGRVRRAFTVPFSPSRYCDGTHGAFYTAADTITAVAEKLHHDAHWIRRRGLAHHSHAVELLAVDVDATVEDITALAHAGSGFMHDTDYTTPQVYAAAAVKAGVAGLQYPSLRDQNQPCAVLFVDSAVSHPRVHKAVTVEWDGNNFIWPPA